LARGLDRYSPALKVIEKASRNSRIEPLYRSGVPFGFQMGFQLFDSRRIFR